MITIQLFKGEGVQPWYLRFVAENGNKLFTSEGYFSKWNAKRAAKRLTIPGYTEFKDMTAPEYRKYPPS